MFSIQQPKEQQTYFRGREITSEETAYSTLIIQRPSPHLAKIHFPIIFTDSSYFSFGKTKQSKQIKKARAHTHFTRQHCIRKKLMFFYLPCAKQPSSMAFQMLYILFTLTGRTVFLILSRKLSITIEFV